MTHDLTLRSDTDRLQRSSAACRARLADDPCDMTTRLTLSWDLLLLAVHLRHNEMFWKNLLASSEQQSQSFQVALRSLKTGATRSSPDASRLFRDSLMQASVVLQLSVEAPQRAEAAKILELAGVVGESQIVAEVDGEAHRILSRVARAICAEKREKTRIPHRFREEDDFDW